MPSFIALECLEDTFTGGCGGGWVFQVIIRQTQVLLELGAWLGFRNLVTWGVHCGYLRLPPWGGGGSDLCPSLFVGFNLFGDDWGVLDFMSFTQVI